MVWFCGAKARRGGGAGSLGNRLVGRRRAKAGFAIFELDVGGCRVGDGSHHDVLETLGECLLRRHALANPEVVAFASALRRLDGAIPLFIGFVIEYGLRGRDLHGSRRRELGK